MKLSRRSLSFALAIIMIFSLLPASALAAGGAVISVSSAEAFTGGTVALYVSIDSNPGFFRGAFEVVADEGLTLTDIAPGDDFCGASMTADAQQCRFLIDGAEIMTDMEIDGVLAVLTFNVDRTAAAGDYSVSLKPADNDSGSFSNYDAQPVPVSFSAGTVTVTAHNHALVAHEAAAATPTSEGNSAYWSCECGRFFSDGDGENEIAEGSWVIPELPHSCEDSNQDHLCDICGEFYNRAPVLREGVSDVVAYVVTGEAYLLRDLQTGSIFEDPDGDPLYVVSGGAMGSSSTNYYYQRSTDGGETWSEELSFSAALFGATTISLTETRDGTYFYRFYARDSYGADSRDNSADQRYWYLTLVFAPAEELPFEIHFYLSRDYNCSSDAPVYPIIRLWQSDGKGNKYGDEIELSVLESENGYGRMNANVFGGWYVYEAYGWDGEGYTVDLGGMQLKLPADSSVDGNAAGGTEIYLGEIDATTTTKNPDKSYFGASDFSVRWVCPTMRCEPITGTPYVKSDGKTYYPAMLYTGGNSCLYNYYLEPSDTDNYSVTQVINQAINKSTAVQSKSSAITEAKLFTATVPENAVFAVYFQWNNFNTTEIQPKGEPLTNEDGTVTLTYIVPNTENLSWRLTDPYGVYVTKAGWIKKADITKPVNLSFDGASDARCSHSFYGLGSLTSARDEADLQVFVSPAGAKAIGSATERFRAYRMWEIINSDTSNIMIEPDFIWTKLSGPAEISYAEDIEDTDIHGGNSYHNWADINANGGTSIFSVCYEAIDIDLSANKTHGGFYPAVNPDRTAFVVIADTLGSATASIAFNGNFTGNPRGDDWDYIYDTWYFLDTDPDPVLDFTVNGAVRVEAAYGVTNMSLESSLSHFVTLSAENGSCSVPLGLFNNASYNFGGTVIIRMTDACGLYSYQLVHVNCMSVTVENQSFPGEPVMPGNTVRLSFDGLYRSINKISGIFNPTIFYLRYTGTDEVNGTLGQYQQLDNSSISLLIPEDVEFEENSAETTFLITNGYVYGSMYSAANPFSSMYNMSDSGAGTNFNAGTHSFSFQRLSDIPVTVTRPAITRVSLSIGGGASPSVMVKSSSGETMSAVDGIYALAYGDYTLIVEADGYIKDVSLFTVGSSDNGEKTVSVTLRPLTGSEWDGGISEPAEVDGVYRISNGNELAWFALQVNSNTVSSRKFNAVLTDDISLNWQLWTPIGNPDHKYSGTFDGDGHYITELYCSGEGYQGLFGYLSAATVKNLGVSGEVTSSKKYAGGIAAYGIGSSVIESCVNKASVTCTLDTTDAVHAGGICGNLGGTSAIIRACYNLGSVTGIGKYVGGINGGYTSTAKVINCYNLGSVTGSKVPASTGAIAGNGTVTNSYYLAGCTNGTKALGAAVAADELKALADTLGEAFKDDAGMINNGYPVLAWEKSEHSHDYINGACFCGDSIPVVEDGIARAAVSELLVIEEGKPAVINAAAEARTPGTVITVPAATVNRLNTASALTINTSSGSLYFDSAALGRIAANSDGDLEICILLMDVPDSIQTDDEYAVYAVITVKCNGRSVFSGAGAGTVTVTVPYDGTVTGDEQVNVYYIDGLKSIRIPSSFSDGQLSFTTSHFSDFLAAKQSADDGYTVAAGADRTVTPGETVNFGITVGNSDPNVSAYSSYTFTITYDASMLTYTGISFSDNVFVFDSNPKGTLTIMGFGISRVFSDTLLLSFSAEATGSSDITIISALVDSGENAGSGNTPPATITANITTVTVSDYTATLPDGFSGEKTAATGTDYTFTADDTNYIYEFNAVMGGNPVAVTDNNDGSYTVSGISGNVVISAGRTGKTVRVSVSGNGKAAVSAAASAVYGTDFSFTIKGENFYRYTAAITIGGEAYTGFTVSGEAYTIPGNALAADVVITVARTYAGADGNLSVSVSGDGKDDVTAPETATEGRDFSFTIAKTDGIKHEVTVSIGGTVYPAELVDNGSAISCTVPGADLTGDVFISVERVLDFTLDVKPYINLDGKTIFLITAEAPASIEGKTLGYGGNAMFSSEKYGAYAWLVISAGSLEDVRTEAAANTAQMSGSSPAVDYSGDANATGIVDINDAQLVYNMYNSMYDSFDSVITMAKFLAADFTGDGRVDVSDAAAIVNVAAKTTSH